jgi:hypothetical protein
MRDKIKKTIRYRDTVIKLYKVDWEKTEWSERLRNIEAFDADGNLLWCIEAPSTDRFYFDAQLDEENEQLEADSGYGNVYIVSLKDGHIIQKEIRK